MKKVEIRLEENCRIICVSDIHGHCDIFSELLKKCGYRAGEDYLFILGDIVEKGRRGIDTVRFIKRLSEESDRVAVIKGNNDTMCGYMAYTDTKKEFLKKQGWRPNNLFCEMAETLGITDFTEDFEEKRRKTAEAFAEEIDFLEQLPLALETDNHIFVHAAIENRPDWENSDMWSILSIPWFSRCSHFSEKYVVVGHFPTYNYAASNNTNLPIVDSKKRIISIDGGCEAKWAGQLNAFIIHKNGSEYHYETVFQTLGEEMRIKKSYENPREIIYCDHENEQLEIVEENGDMLTVRLASNGKIGIIPRDFTGFWGGALHGWMNLNCFISVKKNDTFWKYGNVGDYAFGIYENGQVGLIPSDCV